MNKINLSIIIISYNTKDITKQCIISIYKSLNVETLRRGVSINNIEIIVVDNASTDGSVEMLQQVQSSKCKVQNYSPKFKVIYNKENVGFAKANNIGVKQAQEKYILFLNSDIIVLDDAINKLFEFYRQNENQVHFLGGKLLNKNLSPQPSCGPFYSLPVIFGALFLRGDYWGLTRYSPNNSKMVDWVSGACILTKKDYFNAINGFDENIFMYMDEIDMLYRAKKQNYQTCFYPKARFIHLGSASSNGKTYPIIQVFRGFIYFYKKHYDNPISIFILIIMLKLKALIALLLGRLTNNQYLVKTYAQAYQMAKMDK